MTGIVDAGEYAYHSDQLTDEPCLSKSIAHLLLTASPAHAKAAHPKLNPYWQQKDEQKFDVGKATHSLLLEGLETVEVVYADDWRTKVAKDARDLARSQGRIPMLEAQWLDVKAMHDATITQLAAHDIDPPLFTDGKPEQTLVWQEGDVWCKARLDWLRDDLSAIDDLKTTSRFGGANPAAWTRRALYDQGADLQAAFYLRGLASVPGPIHACMADFRFCVVESCAPYALSVIQLAPSVMEIANAKVNRAIELWRECLTSGEWPAYPAEVAWAELPPWEEARWLEREAEKAA